MFQLLVSIILESFWGRFSTFGRSMFDFGGQHLDIFGAIQGPKAARDTPKGPGGPQDGPQDLPRGSFWSQKWTKGALRGPNGFQKGSQEGAKPCEAMNKSSPNRSQQRNNKFNKFQKKKKKARRRLHRPPFEAGHVGFPTKDR